MTLTQTRKSYLNAALCTALLGLGSVALPTATLAADGNLEPVPVEQPRPQSTGIPQSAAAPSNPSPPQGAMLTTSGSSVAAEGGSLVASGAWCDPVTGICQRHPWTNSAQGE